MNKSYSALENVPLETQKRYYGNIIEMSKQQKELENLLLQYKNTYNEFIATAKNINKTTSWNVERNIFPTDFFDLFNYIPEDYATNISEQQCIKNCLNDPRCKYILFSDSGNGECAANTCMKIAGTAYEGNIKSGDQLQNVASAKDFENFPYRFGVPNPGCEYTKSGPSASLFSLGGWKKPRWFDLQNASFITKHSLGNASSLEDCKKMALNSDNNGPHAYLQYNESSTDRTSSDYNTNNCFYATALDNNLYINQFDTNKNTIVSVASQDTAENMKSLQHLVARLNQLNSAIVNKLSELEKHNSKINKKNINFQSQLDSNNLDFVGAYQKLNNDRTILRKLYNSNNSQDELNASINKNLKMKKSKYWFLEFLI